MRYIYEAPFRVKGLEFGLTRNEIRKNLGTNYESFERGPFSKTKTDYYTEIGLFVNYNKDLIVQSYEMVSPAKFIIENIDILNVPAKKAVEFIRKIDTNLEEDSSGFEAPNIGIEGYLDGYFDNANRPLEGVLVAVR